jgi:hypothetical protein
MATPPQQAAIHRAFAMQTVALKQNRQEPAECLLWPIALEFYLWGFPVVS